MAKPVKSIVPILPPSDRSYVRTTENLIARENVNQRAEEAKKALKLQGECKQLVLEDLTQYASKRIYGLQRTGYLYPLASVLEVFFSKNAEAYPGLIPTRPRAILIKGVKSVGKTTFIKKFFQLNSQEENAEFLGNSSKNLGQTASRTLYWLKWKEFRINNTWNESRLTDFFKCVKSLLSSKRYTVLVIDDLDKHSADPTFQPFVNSFLRMFQSEFPEGSPITLLASIQPRNLYLLDDMKLFPEQYQFLVQNPDVTSLIEFFYEEIRSRIDKSLRGLLDKFFTLYKNKGRDATELEILRTLSLLLRGTEELALTDNIGSTFLDVITEAIPDFESVKKMIEKQQLTKPDLSFTDIRAIIERQSYDNILDFFDNQSFQLLKTTVGGYPVQIPVTLFGNVTDLSQIVFPKTMVFTSEIRPPTLSKIHEARSKDGYGSDQLNPIILKNGILQQRYRAMKRVFSNNTSLVRIMFGAEKRSYEEEKPEFNKNFVARFLDANVFGQKQVQDLWETKIGDKTVSLQISQVKGKSSELIKLIKNSKAPLDLQNDISNMILNNTYAEFLDQYKNLEEFLYEYLSDENLYLALMQLVFLKIGFILEGIFIVNVLRFDFDTSPEPTILLSVWNNTFFEEPILERLLRIVTQLKNVFDNQKAALQNALQVEASKSYYQAFFDAVFGNYFETVDVKQVKIAFNALAEQVSMAHRQLDDCFQFFIQIQQNNISQFGSFEPLIESYPTIGELTGSKKPWNLIYQKLDAQNNAAKSSEEALQISIDKETIRLQNLSLEQLYHEVDGLILDHDSSYPNQLLAVDKPMASHQYFMIASCNKGYNGNFVFCQEQFMASRPLSRSEYRNILGTFQEMSYIDWQELVMGFKENARKHPGPNHKKVLLENLRLIEKKSATFRKVTQESGLFEFWFPFTITRNPNADNLEEVLIKDILSEPTDKSQFQPYIINVNYQLPKDSQESLSGFQTSLLFS
jgi:hypothetical protein